MDIRQSIVGIRAKANSEYKFSGTGFFVEGGLILTCAHVVDAAQVTEGKYQFRVEGQKEFYDAAVAFKSPKGELDICVLKPANLTGDVPPLPLAASRQSHGHKFNAFGYPQQGGFQGLYAKGEIMGWVCDTRNRNALQLSSTELTHGYSGCPILDEEAGSVVGMVSRGFDFGLDKKLGAAVFAIPSEVIKIACLDLFLHETQQTISQPQEWHLAHPYPMPPNFTGRVAERAMLIHWLTEDSEHHLFILCALGGFGKSALTWHWLTHDVDPKEWTKVLWWSFYEGDASFEHFVEETLKYLNRDVPQGKRAQVDELLKAMQEQKILLIMDGFERALRAYSSMSAAYQDDEFPLPEGEGKGEGALDCTDINAETFLKGICSLPQMQGKVLMTTRLTPRAVQPRGEFLQGCFEKGLKEMDKADAVAFFHAQGIQGTHTEIEAACEPYGYHPLSLRLLAGRIIKDFENPGDIRVAQNLKIDGDIIQQKHHVLEVSYNSLPASEQKLLSTLACFRSAVELKTIETITVGADGIRLGEHRPGGHRAGEHDPGGRRPPLRDELRDLVDRGLLHFDDKNKKFDLHPIVRRYAYDRLTAADRAGAHKRLVNYFEAIPKPEKVEKLEDLAPVIELYHHMVRAGNLDEARKLFRDRLTNTLYFQFGAYQLIAELLHTLFFDGEDKPPRLKDESAQAWTLNMLANSYSLSGQPRRAVRLFEMHSAIYEKAGDKKNLAIGLGNVACMAQHYIGALSEAERNLRRSIGLCREIEDEFYEAIGHQELGYVLSYRGAWQEAEQELEISTKYWEKTNDVQGLCLDESYRALRFLLMARESVISNQSPVNSVKSAIECTQRALELADETAKPNSGFVYPIRDYISAYRLLSAAYRAKNELTLAEEALSKALNLCRQINLVEMEANILLDLARLSFAYALREAPGSVQDSLLKDAQEKASEALMITERSGYVLQGADVNLFLAQYALEQEKDKAKAKEYAEKAKSLATCDGPLYYYKVAYEEAERFLKQLGG